MAAETRTPTSRAARSRRPDALESPAPDPELAIRVLPDHVVDQIAAGEVVERPASVVKELVENALDAGATHVTVEVEQGGRELVRVLDNGCGMTEKGARLALLRHATSKLRTIDDLYSLRSMGFRGEALPSIAAVSRMVLITRVQGQVAGTRIVVEGGEIKEVSEVGAPVGTQIEVRDLLFNVPARLKFLKGHATEASHVTDAVSKLAMANPGVHLRLRHGTRTALDTPMHTSRLERVRALLGARLGRKLHEIHGREGGIEVDAFVTAPELAQSTTRGVQLYVGRRPVKDRGLLHAIQMGYGELIPKGRYPVVVLFVEIPGQEVDVNVHPQKLEVRFSDAQAVYAAVRHTVRRGLADAPWLTEDPDEGSSRVRMNAIAASGPPRREPGGASRLAIGHAAQTTRMLFDMTPAHRPVPATSGGVPATSGGVPATSGGVPATSGGVPGTSGAVPGTSGGVPGTSGEVPGTSDGVPATSGGGVPATSGAVPGTSGGVPGTSVPGTSVPGTSGAFRRVEFPVAGSEPPRVAGDGSSMAREPAWPYGQRGERAARDEARAEAGADRSEALADAGERGPRGVAGARGAAGCDHRARPEHARDATRVETTSADFFSRLHYIGQLDRTYLLCESAGELVLVDQHAAHERVEFQRLRERYKLRSIPVQRMLFPLTMELSGDQGAVAIDSKDTLESMGFELEPFGGATFALKTVPAGLPQADAEPVLTELLDELAERGGSRALEERLDLALATIACHSVVRAGDALSDQEVRALFHSMDQVDFKAHCPHGRPVLLRISVAEIARRFGRT